VQNVYSYKHTTILESRLEDGRHFRICDQLAGDADRLLRVAKRNFDTTCEKLTSKLADLAALFHNRNCCGIRYTAQFWLVHLKIEALEALRPSYEFRFGDCLCRFVIHGLDLDPRHGSQAVAIRPL
jgi:hypothetical protein